MRENIEQLDSIGGLLLFLLHVLKLCLLFESEFKCEQFLCLIKKHLIDALRVYYVLDRDGLSLDLTVVLQLLKLTLIHFIKYYNYK